ncbi:MAG: N-acetylneuraminate synthase family protein [Methanobrevibacter sp.]|nr:N-acetylneuraminate synthase family protein [Bacilli bacterium]MBO6274977.1 N-acetylneuraminate synthase family protein [Methanobrevibacter sp.]
MFKIGNIEVGGNDILVIPEIGINHNGSLKVAKEMVYSAYKAGARIIKHQTHVIEDEMTPEAKKVIPGNSDKSIYQIMSECALNEKDEIELKNYTESLGMVYLSTPFSRAAADRLQRMGVVAFKIGSGEMNNYPLLEHIAGFGKPMIVSTGMNSIDDIKKAVAILEKHNIDYALLHTTNLYPTKPEQVRLGAMTEMMIAFPNTVIGLSDHTTNNLSSFAAVALGAKIIERHFTDSFDRTGPDIICSNDEKGLAELIKGCSDISKMLGGKKQPLKEEKVTIDFAFATVCAIEDISSGDILTKENIWVKRPGTGEIKAELFETILGKKAKTDIKKGTHLSFKMIE